MLHCTMNTSISLQLGLDDLLADLVYARKQNELGRLALLAYCEVRCWARQAGEPAIADRSTAMFTEQPCTSKEDFLKKVDALIADLEQLRTSHFGLAPANGFWYTSQPAVLPLARH